MFAGEVSENAVTRNAFFTNSETLKKPMVSGGSKELLGVFFASNLQKNYAHLVGFKPKKWAPTYGD